MTPQPSSPAPTASQNSTSGQGSPPKHPAKSLIQTLKGLL